MKTLGMRYAATAAAAALGLALFGYTTHAAADELAITEDGLPNGYESVTLTTPGWNGGSESVGYVGQQELTVTQDLTTNTPENYNLFVWCVDFGHYISIGSNNNLFTVGLFATPPTGVNSAPPVTFTQPMLTELGWLANYGNTELGSTPNANNAQLSAAVQLAMWQVEYNFTYNPTTPDALSTEVASILNLYSTNPGSFPVTGTPVVLLSSFGVQELATILPPGSNLGGTAAPEPASLALLGAGLAGLGLARRRRT